MSKTDIKHAKKNRFFCGNRELSRFCFAYTNNTSNPTPNPAELYLQQSEMEVGLLTFLVPSALRCGEIEEHFFRRTGYFANLRVTGKESSHLTGVDLATRKGQCHGISV
ncbi:MAG: hypothetical protein C0507_25180 [Cyanobacteria bacterium PR.3.49]|nr:hypothetical protein [Cyanobacteria bacterium PR.3.49]